MLLMKSSFIKSDLLYFNASVFILTHGTFLGQIHSQIHTASLCLHDFDWLNLTMTVVEQRSDVMSYMTRKRGFCTLKNFRHYL